jgi:release factor glutamine methyltransferase
MKEPSIGRALESATSRLRTVGIERARFEARLLLAHCLQMEPADLLAHDRDVLGRATWRSFAHSLARRTRREPLSHILGVREFWSMTFRVGPDVLDPRPDSETLIEAALGVIADRTAPLRLLDLGTGSGCLLLALLSELPNASGLGVDKSLRALKRAAENARRLGFEARALFLRDDWGGSVRERFDLVICNPPYIASDEIAGLMPEIAFEPRLALDGGKDGLDAYRRLASALPRLLKPSAPAVIEAGFGQAAAVARILRAGGLTIRGFKPDLAGRPRAVLAERRFETVQDFASRGQKNR